MQVQHVMATEPHGSPGAHVDAAAEESGEELEWELGGGKDGGAVEGKWQQWRGRWREGWPCGSMKDQPRSLSVCMPAWPAVEAWGRSFWQPSLGARGPGKSGQVPGLWQL